MVKKSIEEEIPEEDNNESIQESDNKNSRFFFMKPWTEQEDNLVRKLVEKYGPQRWSFIAKFV